MNLSEDRSCPVSLQEIKTKETKRMSKRISCLFWYAKRAVRRENGETVVITNADGTVRQNDNYISFLQVISTYWEPTEDGKNQLNIFLNGGSMSIDRNTGERVMKAGYTVVLPEFLGKPFMDQFYEWSCAFGLSATPTTSRSYIPEHRAAKPERSSRSVNAEDFIDPAADETPAASFES